MRQGTNMRVIKPHGQALFALVLLLVQLLAVSATEQTYDDAMNLCLKKLGHKNIYSVTSSELEEVKICAWKELGIQPRATGTVNLSKIRQVLYESAQKTYEVHPVGIPRPIMEDFNKLFKNCEEIRGSDPAEVLKKVVKCVNQEWGG